MAKVTNKTKGFNSISRDVVYDSSLSDRARFLYVYMACKPDGWDFFQEAMAKELGYGKDTLRKYLDELIVAGWITEEEQENNGRFGALQYTIEIEKKRKGKKPIRENTDTEKYRNGKNHNKEINNIDNSPNNSPITKEIEKEKDLSDDKSKSVDDLEFADFYKLYPLKKGKPCAERAWRKLTSKERNNAVDKLQAYIADCLKNKRSFKYPATYLNQRTWEDDFSTSQKISFYDCMPLDSDEEKRFKKWMRATHPEIENTALPLSYEDYMKLIHDEEYGSIEGVEAALVMIENEIWKYRKVDVAIIIRRMLEGGGE